MHHEPGMLVRSLLPPEGRHAPALLCACLSLALVFATASVAEAQADPVSGVMGGSYRVSPTTAATWHLLAGDSLNRIKLLVLWRGEAGWAGRRPDSGTSIERCPDTGDPCEYRLRHRIIAGGDSLELSLALPSRLARFKDSEISLGDANVVVVDSVGGAGGPVIVDRFRIDAQLEYPAEVLRLFVEDARLYEFAGIAANDDHESPGGAAAGPPGAAARRGSGRASASTWATWYAVNDASAWRLELLVLWRGQRGWQEAGPLRFRGRASACAGGAAQCGGSVHDRITVGGVELEVRIDRDAGVARILGTEILLGDVNVVLVDRVDSAGGVPAVVGQLRIEPHRASQELNPAALVSSDPRLRGGST